jgi:hypothetical protein
MANDTVNIETRYLSLIINRNFKMRKSLLIASFLIATGVTAQAQSATYLCFFKAQQACGVLYPNGGSSFESCIDRLTKVCDALTTNNGGGSGSQVGGVQNIKLLPKSGTSKSTTRG